MTVFLIGGCGFLGRSLVNILVENNYQIVIVDSLDRINKTEYDKKFITCDISYPYENISIIKNLINKGDIIVHLAWSGNPKCKKNNYQFEMNKNIRFSVDLFNLAIQKKASKIIFSSSGGAIYGNHIDLPVSEDYKKNPISYYGITKLTVESHLETITKNTATSGISLRIANPYGIYQYVNNSSVGLIATILRSQLFDRKLTIWGDGTTLRDYIHISDVSKAFLKSIQGCNIKGIYNIGTGTGTSSRELIKLVSSCTKIEGDIKWLPKEDFNVDKIYLDSSKFRKISNWKAEVQLIDGIKNLIDDINLLEKS